jgi:hypothetical protein
MSSLDYPITFWILHCGRYRFNTIAVKQFLNFLTREFGSVVKDNSGWPRVAAEPFAVKKDGNVIASFV